MLGFVVKGRPVSIQASGPSKAKWKATVTSRVIAPGRISSVTHGQFDGSNIHWLDLDRPDQNLATQKAASKEYGLSPGEVARNPYWKDDVIYGFAGVNGSKGWTMTYTVEYQLPETVCTDVDWPTTLK